MEKRSPAPLGNQSAAGPSESLAGVSRLEVLARSVALPVTEYTLLADSKPIGELEWIGGRHPELHVYTGNRTGYVRSHRLRPFIVAGHVETRGAGTVEILHVGSAGQGLVEIEGVQFHRRMPPSGSPYVRDREGSVVLRSAASSGKRVLAYDRANSNLGIPELLELTLVEAFCVIYGGRYMLRSLLTAWARLPRMGVPLMSLPKVQKALPAFR